MELDGPDSKDFLLKRIILSLENGQILIGLKAATAYAIVNKDEDTKEYFLSWMKKKRLVRNLSRIEVIKKDPATAYEYYDDDRDNDPYPYDQATEDEATELETILWAYVGSQVLAETVSVKDIIKGL